MRYEGNAGASESPFRRLPPVQAGVGIAAQYMRFTAFLDWALPIPDDDYAVRRSKFVDGLRFRAVVSVAFALVFAGLRWGLPGPQPPMHDLMPLLGILAGVNLPYWYLGKRSEFPLRHFYIHWAIDLLLISQTLLVLGGIDVPYGLLSFLMIVVTSATFLSKRTSFIVATGATTTTLLMGISQMSGAILPPQAWASTGTATNRIIALTLAIVFYYVFAYLAGTLADQLKAVNQNLRNAQSEIEKHSKQLEEKVRTRTRELQNRNSEIEEFVHIVTHDLKNVSVGAIETARILLSREANNLNERARRYLQHLLDDTTQMNAMLVQLLELFKVDERATENRLVDLGGIANDLVRGFKNRIESKGLQIDIKPLPEVVVDETQLRHVLGNLLDNAIKYTAAANPSTISVEAEFSDDEWIVAIKDSGIGIAPNQIDRIFQLYFRGSNVKAAGPRDDGDGVGLAICKRIVERWGGRIWVESVLGKGSTFRFSIPRIAKAA